MESRMREGRRQAGGISLKAGGKPLQWVLTAVLGAVFSAAGTAKGISPFGVAYAAAAGQALPAAAGAFLCYLLLESRSGLVYAASVTVLFTCRLVLEGTAVAKRRQFWPCCAMAALAFPKAVTLSGGRAFFLLLCETALCGGFTLLLREAGRPDSPARLWGRLTAGLGVILAFLPVQVYSIAPARVLGAWLSMAAGVCSGGAMGACVGAALGASVDLAMGQAPFFALLWCVSGLTCGLLAKGERVPGALCYCLTCGILCLWLFQEPYAASALYESFTAGAVLALLPRKGMARVEGAFACASYGNVGELPAAAGQTFRNLSEAVRHLGAVMDGLWNGVPREQGDLSLVYRTACETACRSCRRSMICWQKDFETSKDLLLSLSEPLRTKHALSAEDLPPWFAGTCLRPEVFCGAVNDAYREALRREARLRQNDACLEVMRKQYSTLGDLLQSAARGAGMGCGYDAALENRVRRIVRAYLPGTRVAVCLPGGRLQADLTLPKGLEAIPEDGTAMLRTLESALQAALLPPEKVESREGACWRIRQKESFSMEVCTAIRKKAGETVCGDSWRKLHTDDGRFLLLLSDGMGTGEAASGLSARTLDLVCSFVRSGCGLAEGTAAVLPVLAARFPQWGFVTLDLLEVNLFSGEGSLLKYGAAPCCLLRDGRVTVFSADALPAGLEETGRSAPTQRLRLREGDRFLMMSDGVWQEGETTRFLQEHSSLDGQTLANALLEEAGKSGAADDRTVLLASFFSRKQGERRA